MSKETDLLEQIVENTSGDDSLWISLIAPGSVVLGAALTAVYGYFTAKRASDSLERLEKYRIHTGIITTERLRWLKDLRERFARLQRHTDMQYNLLKRTIPSGGATDLQSKIDELSLVVMEQANLIQIMLNPEKKNQRELQDGIQNILALLIDACELRNRGNKEFSDESYLKLKNYTFSRMAAIGIETWKQIKDKE
jgi:hypothetical protein